MSHAGATIESGSTRGRVWRARAASVLQRQGALVALLFACVSSLAKDAGAHARYACACVALALMLLLPVATACLGGVSARGLFAREEPSSEGAWADSARERAGAERGLRPFGPPAPRRRLHSPNPERDAGPTPLESCRVPATRFWQAGAASFQSTGRSPVRVTSGGLPVGSRSIHPERPEGPGPMTVRHPASARCQCQDR